MEALERREFNKRITITAISGWYISRRQNSRKSLDSGSSIMWFKSSDVSGTVFVYSIKFGYGQLRWK